MKNLLRTLAVTAALGGTYYAGKVTGPALFSAMATAATGPLLLTGHDAAGRTLHATAVYNTFAYTGGAIAIDYTSDQVLCSGFGQ